MSTKSSHNTKLRIKDAKEVMLFLRLSFCLWVVSIDSGYIWFFRRCINKRRYICIPIDVFDVRVWRNYSIEIFSAKRWLFIWVWQRTVFSKLSTGVYSMLYRCMLVKQKNTTLSEQIQNLIDELWTRGKIDTPNTQIHDPSLSWRGT